MSNSIDVSQESEYMQLYSTLLGALDNIDSLLALKVFIHLAFQVEFNSYLAFCDAEFRKTLCKRFGVASSEITRVLKILSEQGLIFRNGSRCYINPQYFWYGPVSYRTQKIAEYYKKQGIDYKTGEFINGAEDFK